MATSSIIENIRVNNPKALEAYIDAIEEKSLMFRPRTDDEKSAVVTDPVRIKRFMTKVLESKGVYR